MTVEEDATDNGCGSRAAADSSQIRQSLRRQKQQRHKLEAFDEVLKRVIDAERPEAQSPSFEDELWNHFNRLPAHYALDVNLESIEDVLMHKRVLELAQDPANRPVVFVRLVHVTPTLDGNQADYSDLNTLGSSHPPPAFGSSPNLEALALEASKKQVQEGDGATQNPRPMYEITFSTLDRPKLLGLLTGLLGELGLNIQEAHIFSTTDGYSLDVFVVDGWDLKDTELLRDSLQKELQNISVQEGQKPKKLPSTENLQTCKEDASDLVQIPTYGSDVWEINFSMIKLGNKVASGSCSELYRGTYCNQDVAIKIFKAESLNADMQSNFAQEFLILQKVRHKNIVQFIGACTTNFCIVTEFMSGGSLYDYLHKQKGAFKLPALLRVAIDISKGMLYLHQNNIIHRDLKAANILLGENEVVKVGDFGVARVKAESGVMTAETGTYRWMAPEVIEHNPYDHKADVFSFAIVLWELMTAKLPYEYLTPLQAAVGVVQKGLRPTIPKSTHSKLSDLLQKCWQQDPAQRPDFSEILEALQLIAKEVGEEPDNLRKKSSSGLLNALRRRQ